MELLDYLYRKTIIVGEVNTGKTTLSGDLLREMCAAGYGPRIAVLDFAPDIPEELKRKAGFENVGGRLIPPEGYEVLYLHTPLRAPRLSTETEAQALVVARENTAAIEALLRTLAKSGRDLVFVNDVSIYLQAGEAGELLTRLGSASTLVVNGYYGKSLGGGILSRREQREMETLLAYFERVIRLG